MKRSLVLTLALLFAACAARKPADPALVHIKDVLARQPNSTPHLYVMASYYEKDKDVRGVVRILEQLDRLGWDLGLGDAFPNSKDDPAFQAVAARLAARERVVHNAERLFTLPETVRSEGITYDPVEDVFYFSGGADKLLRVDRNGTTTDFPIEPFGTSGRLGMDVDAERRQIWTVNAALREPGASALSVYDLRDGRLVRRVTLGTAKEPAFFNDMTLLRDGTAFVTDTNRHQVYRLAPGAESFELWAAGFRWPNGITVSNDERKLYVADFRGVEEFDLATKSRRLLPTDTPVNGIDGLVAHGESLIGIHNVLGRPRVVRIVPGNDRVEVLEGGNPLLNRPATGVVAGTDYVFMANMSSRAGEKVVVKIGL